MSFLFQKQKQQQPKVEKIFDPFQGIRGQVSQFLSENVGKKGPTFKGDRVAPLSASEVKAVSRGEEFADRPTSNLFNLAKAEVERVLSDPDPASSPFFQAVKAEAAAGLEDTNKLIDTAAAAGRRFSSGAKVRARTDAATDVQNFLNRTLAEISRDDRQKAISQARDIETQERGFDRDAISTLTSVGQLPRIIEQARKDAAFEEFKLSEVDFPQDILNVAASLAGKSPTFVERQPAKSKGGFGANEAIQLANLALAFI